MGIVEELLASCRGPAATQQTAMDAAKQAAARADAGAVCDELQALLQTAQAKDALSLLLQATRPTGPEPQSATAALTALRSAVTTRLPSWLHAAPSDASTRVKDLVLVAMAELEHLPPSDRIRLSNMCLSALEEGRPHASTLLELVPPCLLLIPPGAPGDASGSASQGDGAGGSGGRSAADAIECGGSMPQGTPPNEASPAHRDAAVHRLLHAEWRPDQVGAVLSVLRDIPLTPAQAREAVRRAAGCARAAELQQLPPILYQCLLVATAGPRAYALGKVAELFEWLARQPANVAPGGKGPSSVLLQVQGTLLVHIATLVRYDAPLGADWVKHFKAGGLRPSPFLLQVALTMAGVPRLEGQVLQLLRRAAVAAYAAERPGSGCAWLPAPAAAAGGSGRNGSGSGGSLPGVAFEAALLQAVRQSQFAGELVAPGALALGRLLLRGPYDCPLHLVLSCGPRGEQEGGAAGASNGAAAAGAAEAAAAPGQASAATRAVRLGLLLLCAVFEHHPEARDEVLRSCQMGAAKLDACLPQVLLLSRLCRAQPGLLAGHMQPLKECLSHFSSLPPEAAMALLRALWPLCRVRRELQDHVVMLLRKVMYGRDPNSRVVAVRGFIHLILEQLRAAAPSSSSGPASDSAGFVGLDETGPGPSQASGSQASLSQVSALSGGGGVNLLQELTGVLRRALTQQAPVRAALYSGLTQVLAADPRCHELLSELLLPHLERYAAPGDALPPLLLEKCAAVHQAGADPILLEPLPALLSCARRLAALSPSDADENEGSAAGPDGSDATWLSVGMSSQFVGAVARADEGCESSQALQRLLSGLRSRLLRCDAEHFGIDSATDLSTATPMGKLNQLHVSNLLGALEVVLEDVVADCQRLNLAALRDGPTAAPRPGAARDAAKYAAQLSRAFALHQRLCGLTAKAAKAGGGKGKKGAAAPTDAPSLDSRPPQLSAPCLAALCAAVTEDGLLQSPPGGWASAQLGGGSEPGTPAGSGASAGLGGGEGGDGTALEEHVRLVRSDKFRAFVLSSAANFLAAAQRDAAGAALLGGCGGDDARRGWLVLAGPLYKLTKMILDSATAGGRPIGGARAGGPGGRGRGAKGSGGAAATDAGGAGASGGGAPGDGETLEALAAGALHQLVALGDVNQQLLPLARAIAPGPGGPSMDQGDPGGGSAADAPPASQGRQQQAGGAATAAAAADGDAALVAALGRLLPELQGCVGTLARASCFKAAHVSTQTLLLLGNRLAAVEAAHQGGSSGSGSGGTAVGPAARDAVQALSSWAKGACRQTDPEVKHVPLVKALLEVVVRFSRTPDDVAALASVAHDIQRVVGEAGDSQLTQSQGAAFPILTAAATGQPSAAFVLSYLDAALGDVDRAVAACMAAGGADAVGGPAEGPAAQIATRAAICRRLEALTAVVATSVNTVFGSAPIIDAVMRVLTRTYKVLLAAARLHTPPKPERGAGGAGGTTAGGGGSRSGGGVATAAAAAAVTPEFTRLAGAVNKNLTPPLYSFISDAEDAAAKDERSNTLRRAKRDARAIPALVFAVEAWERQLVVAGKAAKVNLMRDAKRSTNRDFKIRLPGAETKKSKRPTAAGGERPPKAPRHGAWDDAAGGGGGALGTASADAAEEEEVTAEDEGAVEEGEEEEGVVMEEEEEGEEEGSYGEEGAEEEGEDYGGGDDAMEEDQG